MTGYVLEGTNNQKIPYPARTSISLRLRRRSRREAEHSLTCPLADT